jgi:lysophospholipase L1-like esterase
MALGISGDQTQHLLARIKGCELTDAAGLQPKTLVVAIGTNNLGAGCRVEDTVSGIQEIVATLRRLRPSSKIMLLGLLPRARHGKAGSITSPKNDFTPRLLKVNAAMRQFAAQDAQHVRYVDAWDLFSETKKSTKQLSNERSEKKRQQSGERNIAQGLMPDMLHPNHRGMRLWGLCPGTRPELAAGNASIG